MKKIILILFIMVTTSSAWAIVPTQSELEVIPTGNPNSFYPHEWIEISPSTSSLEVIFRGQLGNSYNAIGDLSIFLKNHPDPEGSIVKGYWLLMRSRDSPIVYKYETTLPGHYPLGSTSASASFHAPMWHKITTTGEIFKIYSSSSASGPWTQYYSTTLSGLSSYTHIGFASYSDGQPLQMASMTANFSLPTQPSTTISWQNNGDATYSAIARYQRTYRVDNEEAYNHSTVIESLTGQLTREFNGGKWAYDTTGGHPASSTAPGGWTWLSVLGSSQYNFSYNPTTKVFEPVDWDSGPGPASLKALVPWTYDPVTLTWNSTRGDKWQYSLETKKWTHIVTSFEGDEVSIVWSFDYATSKWVNETNSEEWWHKYENEWRRVSYWGEYFRTSLANGIALKYTYASKYSGPGDTNQLFTSDDINFYQTNDLNEKFNWLKPSEGHPYGRYVLYEGGSGTYSLNSLRQWRLNGSGTPAYITPRVPPTVIVQHQDIISAYDAAVAAEILSSSPTSSATWEVNGRSSEFGLTIAYDTSAGTAPLKVTASSPDTQLLSNLLYNPVFTSLGDWEYKDTTNSHTWTFDDATGTWQNNATGYQWNYSNPTALRWHHAASDTYWEYDENTESWTQLVDDGD